MTQWSDKGIETSEKPPFPISPEIQREIQEMIFHWSTSSYLAAGVVVEWLEAWKAGRRIAPRISQLRMKGMAEPEETSRLQALEDLLVEHIKPDAEKKWVRRLFARGFVPSISNDKARREARAASEDAESLYIALSRVAIALDTTVGFLTENPAKVVEEALQKAEERGAASKRNA